MSNEFSKFKTSRRRHKTNNAIAKQLKIAKSHPFYKEDQIRQPHRLAKHHAMDCGNPKCYICGNPRKTHKERWSQQERKLFQDLDDYDHHHNNGLDNNLYP